MSSNRRRTAMLAIGAATALAVAVVLVRPGGEERAPAQAARNEARRADEAPVPIATAEAPPPEAVAGAESESRTVAPPTAQNAGNLADAPSANGVSIRGRVVDSEGRPIRGAEVAITTKETQLHWARTRGAERLSRVLSDRAQVAEILADRLEDLKEREVPLVGDVLRRKPPEAQPPAEEVGHVMMRAAVRVSGERVQFHFEDAANQAETASVQASRTIETGVELSLEPVVPRAFFDGAFTLSTGFSGRRAITDADGRYSIDGVEPGKYGLTASAKLEDERVEAQRGSVVAPSEDVDFTLRAPSTRRSMIVDVVDASSGARVSGANVEVRHLQSAGKGETLGGDAHVREIETGRYSAFVDYSGPGAYDAAVGAPGYRSAMTAAYLFDGCTNVGPIHVEIVKLGTLAGTVRDERTRAPLAKARVVLYAEKIDGSSGHPLEERDSAESDADGRFRFIGLEDGRYHVGAEAPQHLSPTAIGPIVCGPGVPEPETTFSLAQSGTITGVVLDAAGNPAPRARVTLFRDDNRVARTRADKQGLYRFEGLGSGPCEVRAGDGRASAYVVEGETIDVPIRMPK